MRYLFAVLLLCFSACVDATDYPPKHLSGGRFKVERLQAFEDDLAYHDVRGVYLITDTETGQRFVGVSGVGVSELRSEVVGKTVVRIEQ